MEIIEAAEKHVPGMTKLWMEFTYLNSGTDPVDMKGKTVLSQIEKHFKTRIKSPDALVLVALDGDNIIGYSVSEIARQPEKSIGNIYDIVLAPAYRKKGISRKMMESAKEWFASRGVTTIVPTPLTRKSFSDSFWKDLRLP